MIFQGAKLKLNKKSGPTNSETFSSLDLTDNDCPFIDINNLCGIHKEYGDTKLSNVCAVYPRIYNVACSLLEKSGALSCPIIAKLALLNENGMEFSLEPYTDERRVVLKTLEDNYTVDDIPYYFSDIRIFVIDLLQNRTISLEERLMYLGVFIDTLGNLPRGSLDKKLQELFNGINEMIARGALRNRLTPRLSEQYDFLLKTVIPSDTNTVKSTNLRYYLEKVLENLGVCEKNDTALYSNALNQYYSGFYKKHYYMLENYLVNQAFSTLFPFGADTFFNHYMDFILHFIFIRFLLIGVGFTKSGIDIDTALDVITSYSKVVGHSSKAFKDIQDILAKNSDNNLVYIITLINTGNLS